MKKKSKQRGVMQLTTGLVLAAAAGLVGLAGCSAEADVSPTAAESVGEVAQAILCDLDTPCPETSKCGTWTCVKGTCQVLDPAPNGGDCEIKSGFGKCMDGLCCTGCVQRSSSGNVCRPGVTTSNCGYGGGVCQNCDKGNSCEEYSCVEGKRECASRPLGDGAKCQGELGFCNQGSCCAGCIDERGGCQPGNTLTQCGSSAEKPVRCRDCSDDLPCTADACVSGACQAPAVPPGTSCDDGNICNGVSECSGASCTAGTALKCDDGDPCTVDTCDPDGGCKYDPNPGATCNDGDPCTTGEKCDANGKCGSGVVNPCNDNQSCTTDACKDGECVHTPVTSGTTCNDGNGCTTTDTCNDEGKCVGTGGPTCDDDKPCTKNACAANVCSNPFEPATTPCIFDKCTQNSHCAGTSAACVPGTPIDCNDANPCTIDACDPDVGCTHEPSPVKACTDGDACTVDDECQDGACVGTPMPCLAIDACHEPGTCNPLTGRCDDPRSEDGKECPGGSCASGLCEPDPITGEAGAGAGGSGDAGAGGAPVTEGGAPAVGGAADAGSSSVPEPGDGGEPTDPGNVFVRSPGGCSCSVPDASGGRGWGLVGLMLLGALRRRRRARALERGPRC